MGTKEVWRWGEGPPTDKVTVCMCDRNLYSHLDTHTVTHILKYDDSTLRMHTVTHTHTHTRMHACTCVRTHTYTHMCAHTHTCMQWLTQTKAKTNNIKHKNAAVFHI